MVLLAVVLIFALVGLASAAVFVGGKVGSSTASPTTVKGNHPTNGNGAASAEVARARIVATSIVKAAEDSGTSYINSAKATAKKQVAAILAAAHKQAAALSTSAAAAPTSAPPIAAVVNTPVVSSPAYTAPAYTPSVGAQSAPTVTAATSPGTARVPDLHGVPASWQVVGYNATFGAGPGSAGSISVINRAGRTFSGVATVHYANGSSASAPFTSLSPGQALVLPLDGPKYQGGGYHIVLGDLH